MYLRRSPKVKRLQAVFEKLRTGREDKVTFEDLWMLFNSGDTIYSPFQEGGHTLEDNGDTHTTNRRDVPQAYRVLTAQGGIPLTKTIAPRTKRQNLSLQVDPLGKRNDINTSLRMKDKYSTFYVYCFYIDFDGGNYGTVPEIFEFKPYEGEVDIRSLDAYPLHHSYRTDTTITDAELGIQLQDMLVDRGKKFIDLTAVSHMTYEGLTVGERREEINSAVIVDIKLAFQQYKGSFRNPDAVVPTFSALNGSLLLTPLTIGQTVELHGGICRCGSSNEWCHNFQCTFDQYPNLQKVKRQKAVTVIRALLEECENEKSNQRDGLNNIKNFMEERDLIRLLPGVVPGFALRNRKWIQLDINFLEHVKQENNWDDLVLPKGHRNMVQGMVETHAQGSRSTTGRQQDKIEMDLVRGKGRGCIMLLHGAPGVGKTSTAECVAAYTKRPLYPITCGDIGYVPDEVEKNMEQHFELAHKWGCVLLLDEADVFLAKRNKEDVKRNGLVSVFLRILEYYSGILFLTTNRVGMIDDAFRSRLHLTLYYPPLGRSQTKKIWRTNFKRLEVINAEREKYDRPRIEFDDKRIIRWADKYFEELKWNGRQIRNAFQTAVALAEFAVKKSERNEESSATKSLVMSVKDFRTIAEASIQFNEYLLETHGLDEDRTAKRDLIRANREFKSKVKIDLDESEEEDASDEDEESSDDADHDSGDDSDDESEESEKDKKKTKKGKKKAKMDSANKPKSKKKKKDK
ncbi:P-loop containing nucleoside triphosphate hydrolase protein [Rhizodiscina lignyota]|uniref:P-loop containing nucleoside triphosphate hydrolase protein n=1 Tax=Rhizodiscina lignyota TaxID=1504668 RepID=A0A9P4ICN8_9PEZI|nr:P-loop containing nucleoside triphosphate hydrolase protein [Rhizodiscina lignyota]